jgi:hypothetical protein
MGATERVLYTPEEIAKMEIRNSCVWQWRQLLRHRSLLLPETG